MNYSRVYFGFIQGQGPNGINEAEESVEFTIKFPRVPGVGETIEIERRHDRVTGEVTGVRWVHMLESPNAVARVLVSWGVSHAR